IVHIVVEARYPGHERTPRTPTRAHVPLLPSGPGGVRRDGAARGVCPQPNRCRRADRTAPAGRPIRCRSTVSGILVRPRQTSVLWPCSPSRRTRRIRLVAYGARLESVLG